MLPTDLRGGGGGGKSLEQLSQGQEGTSRSVRSVIQLVQLPIKKTCYSDTETTMIVYHFFIVTP